MSPGASQPLVVSGCAWAEVGLKKKKASLEVLGMYECNVFERGEESLKNWSCQGE